MGAPKGNKFAAGNKGGGMTTVDRALVGLFKGLVIREMMSVMKGQDEKKKWELILKMGPHCVPQDVGYEGAKTLIVIDGGSPTRATIEVD